MNGAEDEDPELAELVAANRRGAGLRLVAVGVVIVAIAAGVLFYGRHLEEVQAHSQVQFTLPARLVMSGAIGMIIGALLVLPGIVMLVRSRRRPARLPVAQLRE